MMEELPPQLKHMVAQYQQTQQQAQALATQRQHLELTMLETKKAIEELEKTSPETPVYRSVGSILVRANRDELKKELEEQRETLELRVKTIQRQEERVVERLKELQQKLSEALRTRQSDFQS